MSDIKLGVGEVMRTGKEGDYVIIPVVIFANEKYRTGSVAFSKEEEASLTLELVAHKLGLTFGALMHGVGGKFKAVKMETINGQLWVSEETREFFGGAPKRSPG